MAINGASVAESPGDKALCQGLPAETRSHLLVLWNRPHHLVCMTFKLGDQHLSWSCMHLNHLPGCHQAPKGVSLQARHHNAVEAAAPFDTAAVQSGAAHSNKPAQPACPGEMTSLPPNSAQICAAALAEAHRRMQQSSGLTAGGRMETGCSHICSNACEALDIWTLLGGEAMLRPLYMLLPHVPRRQG